MAINVEDVALSFINVVANVAIPVAIPVAEEDDVIVYFGNSGVVAVPVTDYTVTLPALGTGELTYPDFTVTPKPALIAKIAALILADPTEINTVTVRRTMRFETEATFALVRNTYYTAAEFDRMAMRLQQLDEKLNRALVLPPQVVGDTQLFAVVSRTPDTVLKFDVDGNIASGPSVADVADAQQNASDAAADAAQAAVDRAAAQAAAAAAAASAAAADVTRAGNQTFTGLNVFDNKVRIRTDKSITFGNTDLAELIYQLTGDKIVLRTFNTGTKIEFDGDAIDLRSMNGVEKFITAVLNGAVSLYFDDTKRFETTSVGAKITGSLNVDTILSTAAVLATNAEAIAGALLTKIINPASLKAHVDDRFTYLIGSTGYIGFKLNDAVPRVYLEWGRYALGTAASASQRVTFPQALSVGVQCAQVEVDNAASNMIGASSADTTGMTIVKGAGDTGARNGCWFIIGA